MTFSTQEIEYTYEKPHKATYLLGPGPPVIWIECCPVKVVELVSILSKFKVLSRLEIAVGNCGLVSFRMYLFDFGQ